MIKHLKRALKRPGTLIPVFFFAICNPIHTQYLPPATESAGIGNCFTVRNGISCASGNQAGLAWDEDGYLSADFAMPFNLPEFGIASLTASLPVFNGVIAGRLFSRGVRGYHEGAGWVSYGLRIGEQLAVGTGIYFEMISISSDPVHSFAASFAGGIQYRINDMWQIGGHLLFPYNFSKTKDPGKRLPPQLSMGCGYQFYRDNMICLEYRYNEVTGHAVIAGIESRPADPVVLRTGLISNPFTFTMGFGYRFNRFELTVASQLILRYGLSSFIGLQYAL